MKFISKFPKFLDQELIEYFFTRSHKEIEYNKCDNLIVEIKELVKKYRGIEYRKKKSEKIIHFNKKLVSILF